MANMDASEPALAKSVGTYDSRTGRLKWESTAIETLTVGLNKDIWFKGKDLATALGYKDAKVAVHDRVDAADKLPLQELMQQGGMVALLRPQLSNDLRALWINEFGLYDLVLGSKLPGARQFKHWVTHDVLPAIRKTGSYAPNSEEALLKAYHKMQVVYYGDVGVHKGEHLLKFGCSDSITNRVHDGHKKDFPEFTLQNVFSAMNNREVESKLKEDAEIKKRRVTRTINEKKQTELIVLSADFTCKDLDAIIHRTIAQNPPGLMNSLKRQLETEDKDLKMRKLDMQIEMRRIELELDIKKADNEVELKRLELQHELEMTKLHYAHKGPAELALTGHDASNAATEHCDTEDVAVVEQQGHATEAIQDSTRKIVVVDQAQKRRVFNSFKEAADDLHCHTSTVKRGLKEPGKARKGGLKFSYE